MAARSTTPSLECRVCHESYGLDGARVPRLLHGCGHTICQSCVLTLINRESSISNQLTLLCPFDRICTVLVHENGVHSLRKNFALVELLEKLEDGSSAQTEASADPVAASAEPDKYLSERELGIDCDENSSHRAVVYCVVCHSNLCLQCSESTHVSRVLAKHRRVPLSQKPQDRPKCSFHSAYAIEFVCQESCCSSEHSLMCLLCRDYGRHAGHRHALLEIEAGRLRQVSQAGVTEFRRFTTDLIDWAQRLTTVVEQIDGLEGSAESARRHVRQHFGELRDTLLIQETAALTVVEAFSRDKLATLRRQLDDVTAMSSQISAVCTQLEKSSGMDDARLLSGKEELSRMLDTARQQQTEFSLLPTQVNLDSAIPLTFTKDNRVHIGPNVEMRVVVLGLDNAGKTTILFKLKQNEIVSAISTIGFNVETVEYKNLKLTLWDVGGLPKLRPLWKHYYLNTQALIFVVDSCDRERFVEVQSELVRLLSENELKDAALLVMANKQQALNSSSAEELEHQLTLHKLCYGRSWHVQPCDALSGQGLWEGVDWLARQLLSTST